MKILVIHQVPYRKIQYHLGIDHDRHDVTYVGMPDRMADLPADLPCRRIVLDADQDMVEGIIGRTSPSDGYREVLALSEFGILEAWHVRRHLGLDGPTWEQLQLVRDKVRMKQALAASDVRYPRFVPAPASIADIHWDGRTVIKPRQGASSEGVTIHDTAAAAFTAYRKLDDRLDFQLEEYIEGEILHADGLVSDSELVNVVVSQYVGRPVDFVTGEPLGSHQIQCTDQHREFIVAVLEALQIDNGCLHLEFFETPDGELVFLEVANRMGGAGVVDAHLRHTGVHLPTHEIAIRLGLPRPEPEQPTGRFHGWMAFPGHHLDRNQHLSIAVPPHLPAADWVDFLHIRQGTEKMPAHVSYQEWEVPVFVEGSHFASDRLRAHLKQFAQDVAVRMVRKA
ncbi:acetyl-CoA carboxylase biotin carboxylase subunit family protein [Actinoplanes sp. NPDC051859]|uniref:acetyl-CoA carboxylase biotin carboxylase subunit family protein n=1 Tax=Actinoplanes sp. NPDC051859 TaxID=3363909 RepID=UPI0037B4977D